MPDNNLNDKNNLDNKKSLKINNNQIDENYKKNLTSKLLLRSTLLGSMSSLSKKKNIIQPKPSSAAQLLLPKKQHQHQQQKQQKQHQQQEQSTETIVNLINLDQSLITNVDNFSIQQQDQPENLKNNKMPNLQSLMMLKLHSRTTSSSSSSSSSSASSSNESLANYNGIDLDTNNGNIYYNPANTEPIISNRLANLTKNNDNHWQHNQQQQQETTFSNNNNNNQTYMTQTKTFLAYHNHNQNQQSKNDNNGNDNINNNDDNGNGRLNYLFRSTTNTIGMTTMNTTPSTLISLPLMLQQQQQRSNSTLRLNNINESLIDETTFFTTNINSNNNNNNKYYILKKSSPTIRPPKHPLIEITRTRALSRAKLKQSSQVSALLSGFALVAMVEMDIKTPSTIPLPLLIFFITVTTMLVSVHMIALMISTCILPHIESMNAMQDLALTLRSNEYENNNNNNNNNNNSNMDLINNDTTPLLINENNNNNNINNNKTTTTTTIKNETRNLNPINNNNNNNFLDDDYFYGPTPHQKMSFYISIAWFFSTVIGIFLFMLELVAIVWVKFWDHHHDDYLYNDNLHELEQQQIQIQQSKNYNQQHQLQQSEQQQFINMKYKQHWINDGKFVAIIASLILIPALLALIFFAHHFYHKLVSIKWEFTKKVLDELDTIVDGLKATENI